MSQLVPAVVGSIAFVSTSLAQVQLLPPRNASTLQVTGGVVFGQVGGQAPARDNPQIRSGTAVLRGRVVADDTGQPLRKAQVRIFGSPGPGVQPENRLATTDASGRYEFKDLPAGRYTLTATKGSYVSLQYGQQRPFGPGKPLEVADGQTIERIDFSLPRGGVIAGRVLDEFGEPVADVQVSPMRYQFGGQGGRRLQSWGRSATTNDIGEFRIFGLPPGDYYVSAILRNFSSFGESDDRSGYAPTYYPGTAEVAAASKLSLGLAQAITDISIPLLPSPHRASQRHCRRFARATDARNRHCLPTSDRHSGSWRHRSESRPPRRLVHHQRFTPRRVHTTGSSAIL